MSTEMKPDSRQIQRERPPRPRRDPCAARCARGRAACARLCVWLWLCGLCGTPVGLASSGLLPASVCVASGRLRRSAPKPSGLRSAADERARHGQTAARVLARVMSGPAPCRARDAAARTAAHTREDMDVPFRLTHDPALACARTPTPMRLLMCRDEMRT